jgi:hypothetical protein
LGLQNRLLEIALLLSHRHLTFFEVGRQLLLFLLGAWQAGLLQSAAGRISDNWGQLGFRGTTFCLSIR